MYQSSGGMEQLKVASDVRMCSRVDGDQLTRQRYGRCISYPANLASGARIVGAMEQYHKPKSMTLSEIAQTSCIHLNKNWNRNVPTLRGTWVYKHGEVPPMRFRPEQLGQVSDREKDLLRYVAALAMALSTP